MKKCGKRKMEVNHNLPKIVTLSPEEVEYIHSLIRLDVADCGVYLEGDDRELEKGDKKNGSLEQDMRDALEGRIKKGKRILSKMGLKGNDKSQKPV